MIDLTGLPLTGASVDEASTLSLRLGDGWLVTIENDYAVACPTGVRRTEADDGGAVVASLQQRVGTVVSRCTVSSSGELTLGLGDTSILVAPHASFEAWSISGPQRQLVVCVPGGELTTWGPDDGSVLLPMNPDGADVPKGWNP